MSFPKVLLTFCSDLNLKECMFIFSHAQASQTVLSVFCIDFRFSSQLVFFFLDAFCFTCFSSGPHNSACRPQMPKESNSRNESRSNNFVTKWMGTSWATQKWGVWKKTVSPHMYLLRIVSVFLLFLVCPLCSLFSVIFPVSFSLRYCSSDATKSKELATKRTGTSPVTTKWGVCNIQATCILCVFPFGVFPFWSVCFLERLFKLVFVHCLFFLSLCHHFATNSCKAK